MVVLREAAAGEAAIAGEALVEINEIGGGELVATVSWGDWVSDGITRHGDSTGPMPVGEALRKADEVADLYDLKRVVVSLPSGESWNPAWGKVSREPHGPGDDVEFLEADDGDEGQTPLQPFPT